LGGKPDKPIPNSKLRSTPVTNEVGAVPSVDVEPDLFELEEEIPHVLEEDDLPPLDLAPEGDVASIFGPTLRRSTRTR
jgi:hypothetical protein